MLQLRASQIRNRTSPPSTSIVNSSSNVSKSFNCSIVLLRCLRINWLWTRLWIDKKIPKEQKRSPETLQREQLVLRGKEHWPQKCVVNLSFSLFHVLTTTQQPLETWGPGVVSLHVKVSYFSTTAWWVTSPTWGPHLHVNRPWVDVYIQRKSRLDLSSLSVIKLIFLWSVFVKSCRSSAA